MDQTAQIKSLMTAGQQAEIQKRCAALPHVAEADVVRFAYQSAIAAPSTEREQRTAADAELQRELAASAAALQEMNTRTAQADAVRQARADLERGERELAARGITLSTQPTPSTAGTRRNIPRTVSGQSWDGQHRKTYDRALALQTARNLGIDPAEIGM
jgi:hypothetical protein